MQRDVLIERFFTTLISGDRPGSRAIVDEVISADCPADKVLTRLFWPTLEHIQTLFRADQLSNLAHHYSTRLLRNLADQMQLRLEQRPSRNRKVLLTCGPDESEELTGQIAADMLEADGYSVFFCGGGVANDEIVAAIGENQIDVLLIFGAAASTVPYTRLLIDHLHDIDVCPKVQIAVGGGVFNRAEGLAEEIGADIWARDPEELIQVMDRQRERRMASDQRTVGRKRKVKVAAA
ncbi:MAG: cobalamin-dependent protein [Phycisphaeraceae bacterium]